MKTPSCMAPRRRAPTLAPGALKLAPWFHNLHLPDGTQTAPEHPLGNFPACKWAEVAPHVPEDLSGWTVLDVGCNAGFYAIELARRGAHVLGVDREPHFLRQARWAVRQWGLEDRIELRRMQVYDLARLPDRFDLVIFMGVLYHLRYPLLGLDLVAEKVRRLMVFQTMTMPGDEVLNTQPDYGIDERAVMLEPGWPTLAFIEKALAGDASNWWAPNHAGVEAMLRSAGMRSVRRLAHEIYLCEPGPGQGGLGLVPCSEELNAATGRWNGWGDGDREFSPAPAARKPRRRRATPAAR